MGAELVSIDIGSSKMKFVVGKAGRKNVAVKKLFYAATPANAVNNGEIVDIKLMREALMVAIKNNKLSGKNAVVTIQSSTFISREFIIPRLKDKEVESTLRFEVEQYMPVALEDYVLSYRELEKFQDEDGQAKIKYMVGLMPQRIVSSYYDLLKSAGLKPVAMDVNSNAIEKFLDISTSDAESGYGKHNIILVADIGNDAMDMTVFENGFPKINRTVPIGGSEITRSIVSTFGVDFEVAEVKKIQSIDMLGSSANIEGEAAEINNVAKPVVADWAEQLRRMIEFYMSRTKGKGVDCVYIYGGSSAMKNLNEYFSGVFDLKVYTMALPNNVKLKDTSPAPIFTFLNAIGAIIRR